MSKSKKGEQLFRDMLSVINSLNRIRILSEASLTPARTHVATVDTKLLSYPLVDNFITEVSQDIWIYFPWDLAACRT
jgi:hypothetical protein